MSYAEKVQDELNRINARAAAVEDNEMYPGEPTLVGAITALTQEIAEIRVAIDHLREQTGTEPPKP